MRPLKFIMLSNIIVTGIFCLAESDHSELFFGHDKAIKIAFANKSVKIFEFFKITLLYTIHTL